MSKWTEYLNKYYQDKKKTNASYTFTQAMKDASKSYKKSKTVKSSSGTSEEECIKSCMKSNKGGSKKNRSSRKVKRGGTVVAPGGDMAASHIEPHAPAVGVATTATKV